MRLVSFVCLFAALDLSAATIVSRAVIEPPKYESVRVNRTPEADYARAAADKRFKLEKITYRSDDLEVFAYLYAPVQAVGKQPCVIVNRGSFIRDEFVSELLTMFHRLGEAGFVVIAPMLRGSGGAPGRDEVGGADLADLMRMVDVAREIDLVDPARMFMYGQSRGGAMTYMAIRDGFPMRAAAVFGAFSDFGGLVDETPSLLPVVKGIWPDYEQRRAEISAPRSAIKWADKLNVPLLIMQGGNDKNVNPNHALSLATRLQELGKRYELVIRADGNHILLDWQRERDALAIEWFRRHMN